MGCAICGRSSCTPSFHSHEEQQQYEESRDKILEQVKDGIETKVSRIDRHWFEMGTGSFDQNGEEIMEEKVFVDLNKVLEVINQYQ